MFEFTIFFIFYERCPIINIRAFDEKINIVWVSNDAKNNIIYVHHKGSIEFFTNKSLLKLFTSCIKLFTRIVIQSVNYDKKSSCIIITTSHRLYIVCLSA